MKQNQFETVTRESIVKEHKNKNLTSIKRMPDILKVPDICVILDCSEYFVRKLIREKKLNGIFCGKGYRVTKKSLLNFLEGGVPA